MEKKIFNKIKLLADISIKYGVIVTSILYILGYIYTMGVKAGFYKDNILAVYNFNNLLSFNFNYLFVGIKFFVNYLFVDFAISGIVVFFLKDAVFKRDKKNNEENNTIVIDKLKNKTICKKYSKFVGNYNKSWRMLSEFIRFVCTMAKYLFIGMSNTILIFYLAYNLDKDKYFNAIKCIIVILSVLNFIYIFIDIKLDSLEKAIVKILLVFFIFTNTFLFSLLCGAKYTNDIITNYDSGDGELYVTRIYKEEVVYDYISLQDESEVFIGYNLQTRNVDSYPIEQIDKIEYSILKRDKKYYKEKYHSNGENTKINSVINFVNDYYLNTKVKFSSKWIRTNFTLELYKDRYNNIDEHILENIVLSKDDSYIGIECAVPEIDEKEKTYNVKVREYYKSETKFTEIHIKEDNDKFLIYKILNNIDSFSFQNY
ncbi:MAG: hypothetical protein E7I47_04740 [Clostridium sp.]|uniref:hypothetical protein n=1 Tax=Clostridium sp. TaxID=1506 RepID=UPI002673FA16|nr:MULTISPECIES: hypothetical protein [Clostridium]MDU4318596.1 hypothetical protein [Clostridium sp.]